MRTSKALGALFGVVGVLFAGAAVADDLRPASVGTVTVYVGDKPTDKDTVFFVHGCTKDRFGVWKYAGCSNEAAAKAKQTVCAKKGSGKHWIFTQLGDQPAKAARGKVECK